MDDRDEFAKAALPALITDELPPGDVAALAYEYADAMLAERAKKHTEAVKSLCRYREMDDQFRPPSPARHEQGGAR